MKQERHQLQRAVSAVEDTVAISFVTQDGAPGTAHWNFTGGYIEDDIDITGTKGRISLSRHLEMMSTQIFTSDGIEKFDLPNPVHIQTPMILSIADELPRQGKCPSTGEIGVAERLEIMDTALDSYYGGRADAFWARPDTWPGRPT